MPGGQSPRGKIAHPPKSKIDSSPPIAKQPIILLLLFIT
jgi:hypothetical protein